jgi:hypothetical protein
MTPLIDVNGDTSLQQYYNGFGYVMVTVTGCVLTIDFYPVHPQPAAVSLDSVSLGLGSHTVTSATRPLVHPLPGEGGRTG